MKNANGEGSLRQRKDGSWEFRIQVEGRKSQLSFYSRDADGRGAKKKYRAWLKSTGGRAPEKVETVAGWSEVWLAAKKASVVYGTYANYARYTNGFILPALGHLKLEAVRPYHIARLYAGPEVSSLSNSAKNEIRVCLNGIFRSARKNRLCLENPAEDEDFSRQPPAPPQVFSIPQVQAILTYAPAHKWGAYAQAALLTGLRTEELCALTWGDVHPEDETPYLRIHQVIARAESEAGRKYELRLVTKSKRERVVALTEQGATLFRSLPKEGIFVFPGIRGSAFLTPPQFAQRWGALLRDLNRTLPPEQQVPLLSPHKARHTYASALLNAGANIRAVQDQLGHARITTTEIYTHVDLATRLDNVRKLAY